MEQEYKIAALIQRYVSGNATEEERNEVERWMAESEEHGVLMEKFRSDVFLQEQLAEHGERQRREAQAIAAVNLIAPPPFSLMPEQAASAAAYGMAYG